MTCFPLRPDARHRSLRRALDGLLKAWEDAVYLEERRLRTERPWE